MEMYNIFKCHDSLKYNISFCTGTNIIKQKYWADIFTGCAVRIEYVYKLSAALK
jgi:hypothetical protein